MKTLIKEAAQLNENGVKMPARTAMPNQPMAKYTGWYFTGITKNGMAFKIFESFAPSLRKEYIRWVVDAKVTSTRERGISQAVQWIAEGKGSSQKYE